ncbi:MAG: LysM repeat protein [Cryomorphaceae bacterium]|jgi:LysM repeat protein
MKNNKLQTKRKPQRGFRAIYARTVGKKVKASAAASAEELDGDVPSVGIGKALSVILILHVLAIAAIYVGTQWRGNDDDSKGNGIALDVDKENTDEQSEMTNDNPGTVYLDTPASYDLDNNGQSNSGTGNDINDRPNNDQGLTVEPRKRRPRVIKPRRDPNKPQALNNPTVTAYNDYKIQKGDNFYRLAKRYKVKQQKLIDMNPNVNASRMKIGMIVKVPQE